MNPSSIRPLCSLLGALSLLPLSGCGADTLAPLPTMQQAVRASYAIDPAKELVITDPSVVASPAETAFDPSAPSGTSVRGAWSFGRLIQNMLPKSQRGSAQAASQLVMAWMKTWEVDQSPNPGVRASRARSATRLLLIEPWKTASGCASPASPTTDFTCTLDFTKAPFQLMAIVNRPDLRIVSDGKDAIAGEGRFVFQLLGPTLGVNPSTTAIEVMDPTVKPQKFTVIFEYSLPTKNRPDIVKWAQRWHGLGGKSFGSEYNAALLDITNDFSGPDTDTGRPNGNALDQLRTNEVASQGARFPLTGFLAGKQVWEIREFHLTAAALQPHTVNLEPARDFDIAKTGQTPPEGTRTSELISFLDANAAAVLDSTHVLPAGMSGNSALVGSAPYGAWGKLVNPNPPAIPSQGVPHDLGDVATPVRDSFAINTCAGCHRHETDTRHFMHVTLLGAMDPLDKTDDRTRVGVPPGTPDGATILSNFLKDQIAPGGDRYEDYNFLLSIAPGQLKNKPGLRACAPAP